MLPLLVDYPLLMWLHGFYWFFVVVIVSVSTMATPHLLRRAIKFAVVYISAAVAEHPAVWT